MASPSMVHRTGDTLVVKSVVSGEQLFKDGTEQPSANESIGSSLIDGLPEELEIEDELDLPQCKIKRNYICQHCIFFTQNPRSFLYHLKDVHKEKIKVYECPHCLYASKHSQKLQRHIHMIHIRGPIRRRAPLSLTRRRKAQASPLNMPSSTKSSSLEEEQISSVSQHFLLGDNSPIEDHQSMEIDEPEESSFDPLVMDDSEEHDYSEEGSLRIDDTADSPSPNEENSDNQTAAEALDGTNGEFKCSVCDFQNASQLIVSRHERTTHLKKKFYRCAKCNYVTHMKARYTKHVKYHSMPMIKCDLCDFRTPYKWNLDRHHKNHEGRGQFKCVACNFTAEIKQSLTVHEMNHHVPPVVGTHKVTAGGPIGGRRRNKVGASDTIVKDNEDDVINQMHESLANESEREVQTNSNKQDESDNTINLRRKQGTSSKGRTIGMKLKSNKKQKVSHSDISVNSINDSDFIHPDDIVHRSNGTVYIKHLKCQHCSYKSAWSGEITRHEARVHGIIKNDTDIPSRNNTRKAPRPIPNLIPIQGKPTPPTGQSILKTSQSLLKVNQSNNFQNNDNSQQALSERDLNEICAKSCLTSALKDFASLIGGPDAFKIDEPNTPPKSPNTSRHGSRDNSPSDSSNNTSQSFKRKNASFFDKLKEKLMGDAADGGGDAGNLVCSWCGHQSKCLSEQARHQKLHSKTTGSSGPHNETDPTAPSLSTRCQYCRQRCKTSHDLANHVLTCQAASGRNSAEPPPNHLPNGDSNSSDVSHPMENRVFVWNHLPEQVANTEEDQTNNTSENTQKSTRKTKTPTLNNESPIINPPENPSTSSMVQTLASTTRSTSNSPDHKSSGNNIVETVNDNLIGVETAPGYGAVTMKSDDSTHTIKKVFRCPHCSFWASTASRFHVHIVGHLNKKPFECSLCAYRSNWRWDITKHIRLKSARDVSHMFAKVLMTDETGRRNYTKYNKYLAVMKVQEASPADIAAMGNRKSKGGIVAPPGNNSSLLESNGSNFQMQEQSPKTVSSNNNSSNVNRVYNSSNSSFPAPPKLIRAPTAVASHSTGVTPLRPPPPLRAAHPQQNPPLPPPLRPHLPAHQSSSMPSTMSGTPSGKKTLWKCKKCSFKHVSREAVLNHVRDHYDIKTTAPQDEFPSTGTQEPILNCTICPFTCRNNDDMNNHKDQHTSRPGAIFKCYFCPFYVSQKRDLLQHMTLHGVNEPEDYISKAIQNKTNNNLEESNKSPHGDDQSFSEAIAVTNTNKEDIPLKVIMDKNYKNDDEEQLEQLRALQSENHEHEMPDEAEDGDNDIPDEDDNSNIEDKLLHYCQYCPARFLTPRAIEMHIRYHRMNLPHACASCSYSSRTAEQLSTHIKVHSDSYQEMTECLAPRLNASTVYPRPRTAVVVQGKGLNSPAWVVIAGQPPTQSISLSKQMDTEKGHLICSYCPAKFLKQVALKYHVSLHGSDGHHKCRHCNYAVKTYGNLMRHELLHRKSVDSTKTNGVSTNGTDIYSARNNESSTSSTQLTPDPQFGTLIHGSSAFVYPTYVKNGRLKEKRYKCHKCPTAFEKRDQYKVHLSLHGSKQKYKCEKCDYSVKYYANYIQHIQKHEKSEAAQAEKRGESSEEDIPFNEVSTTHKAIKSMPVSGALKSQGDGPLQLSTADKQYLLLQKAKAASQAASAGSHREAFEFRRRNIFCPRCPYYHTRRDRVDSHLRGHYAVSKVHYEHKCNSCDFSTNNSSLSKEHTKLHFTIPIKAQAEIFAKMDGIELWTSDDLLLFQDKGTKTTEDRFLPPNNLKLGENVTEKTYVNLNGVTIKYNEEDKSLNEDINNESNSMNVEAEKIHEDDVNENTNDQLMIDENGLDTNLDDNSEKIQETNNESINNNNNNNSKVPLETSDTNIHSSEMITSIETEDSDSNSTSSSSAASASASSNVSLNNSNHVVQNINENSLASTSSRSVNE